MFELAWGWRTKAMEREKVMGFVWGGFFLTWSGI
jgi:hypothetical protein